MSEAIANPIAERPQRAALSPCRCGAAPRRFHAPQGHYVLCSTPCQFEGSGVYPSPSDAARAWNRLQEVKP